MAPFLKGLTYLTALLLVASAEDYSAYDNNMCAVDDLAAILCDICSIVMPAVTKDACCVDANTMWQCEQLVSTYSNEIDNEAANEYGSDYDYYDTDSENTVDKRATWTYNKPTANRLYNAMYDLGFRGKRYSTTGRFSWKPFNYRLAEQMSPGFRGKRFPAQEVGESSFPMPYDAVNKRAYSAGYFDWKPAAYRLSDPYRYDRLGYMGKRSDVENDMDKRARYASYQIWRPAPYRLDSDYMWDSYGKRGRYSYTTADRFAWKPRARFEDYLMYKRGDNDLYWKPAAYRMENDYGQMGKRFNIGLGRWDWKPNDDNKKAQRGKRGRWDWKPSSGYHGYGLDIDSTLLPGKRPFAQFDWKPNTATYRQGEEKRSPFSIRSQKPWRPAAYRIGSDQLWGGRY